MAPPQAMSDETPAEAKPKVNPTATATADGDMSPAGESIHKKFEYKRWSAGVRAKSKPGHDNNIFIN